MIPDDQTLHNWKSCLTIVVKIVEERVIMGVEDAPSDRLKRMKADRE